MRIRHGYMVIFCLVLALLIPLGRWVHAQDDEPNLPIEAQSANVEILGQIGNVSTQIIAIQGKVGYVGMGTRLVMVDLSDPSHPRLLEQVIELPGRVVDIQIAGVHAFVAVSSSGIYIFNISTPTNPIRIGSYQQTTSFYVSNMEVRGNYIYISAGLGGLIILDVSDPTHPTKIGTYGGEVPSSMIDSIYVTGVALVDNYAYTLASYAYYSNAVKIIDVTNPMSPTQVSEYQAPISAITIEDQRAYMVSINADLQIFDVSDPVTPTLLGSYTPPGNPRKVVVAGGKAYLITANNGLRILNIADPKMPIETSFYMPDGTVQDIAVDKDTIYIAAEGSGLHIIDTGDPYAPTVIGTLPIPLWDARYLLVTSGYALVASIPRYYGAFASTAELLHGTGGDGVKEEGVSSSRALVPTDSILPTPIPIEPIFYPYGPAATLYAVKVMTPTSPSWSGQPMPVSGLINMTAAKDDLYAFNERGILTLYKVTDPVTPVELGSFNLANSVYYSGYQTPMAASNRYAYVASQYQLNIIDFTTPTTPTQKSLYLNISALDLATEGNYLYVAGDPGVLVIDISDPTEPQVVSHLLTQSPVSAIQVVDGYAYMVTGGLYGANTLRILDVSTLDNIREVGSYATPGAASTILVANGYAYVGDSRGLRIYNVIDPTRPWVAAAFDTNAPVTDLALSGDEIYLAATYQGLVILKFVRATWTLLPPSGGVLRSPFDQTLYTFTAGTFTETVTLKHTTRSATTIPGAENLIGIGHFFETGAQTKQGLHLQPTKPYQLEVQYSTAKVARVIETTLALYFWDGDKWIKEPTSMLDAANRKVTATPQQLGRWAILGETHRTYMPVISRAR